VIDVEGMNDDAALRLIDMLVAALRQRYPQLGIEISIDP
jgi:hypothetical protein